MWLKVINKVKVTHRGEVHIKVKDICPFQLNVAHTVNKRVVCIRMKYILVNIMVHGVRACDFHTLAANNQKEKSRFPICNLLC